jgi:hypothetical protein
MNAPCETCLILQAKPAYGICTWLFFPVRTFKMYDELMTMRRKAITRHYLACHANPYEDAS